MEDQMQEPCDTILFVEYFGFFGNLACDYSRGGDILAILL